MTKSLIWRLRSSYLRRFALGSSSLYIEEVPWYFINAPCVSNRRYRQAGTWLKHMTRANLKQLERARVTITSA